jgi:molybdopterin-containing oxidoreductase family membrane subunit
MLETALKGSQRYWGWLGLLVLIIAAASIVYIVQLNVGLTITGMSRDVSWGFYIAQFTYLVGVAAAAVMLVLPYYFHNFKAFKRMIILAEFQAIAAVIMCLLFIIVDLGQPARIFNVILHPTPNSILFWDMVVLNVYLLLNIIIGWTTLEAERKRVTPGNWIKPLIYLSIIWAFSIHTVTAFLYQGLPGRHFWLTAIMAARFLSSAFCSGPAILLLVALLVKKLANYDPGREAVRALAKIITYAMAVNVFFFLLEVFTGFYSNIPGHQHPITFLFTGLEGHTYMVPWMWTATVLAFVSLILLIPPKFRDNPRILPWALVALVAATWIDKGLALLIGGFTPNPFEGVTPYWPTLPEAVITVGIYAVGALVLTVLYKVAISVKKEVGHG